MANKNQGSSVVNLGVLEVYKNLLALGLILLCKILQKNASAT